MVALELAISPCPSGLAPTSTTPQRSVFVFAIPAPQARLPKSAVQPSYSYSTMSPSDPELVVNEFAIPLLPHHRPFQNPVPWFMRSMDPDPPEQTTEDEFYPMYEFPLFDMWQTVDDAWSETSEVCKSKVLEKINELWGAAYISLSELWYYGSTEII